MTPSASLRDRLRALPVFPGELPRFDTDAAPADPIGLLVRWLELAIEARVAQPHAMSIATASRGGEPSNRTLLLKDIDAEAVWFASLSSGPKGLDLAENPRAALLLLLARAGQADPHRRSSRTRTARGERSGFPAAAPECARPRDRRKPESADPRTDEGLASAKALMATEPDHVPEAWTAYRVIPDSIEFWQAERERDQVRLCYRRESGVWNRELLWP